MADAYGLIKIGKSGALPRLLSAVEILEPAAVYGEAVLAAEELLWDAPSLGAGERSALPC